MERRPRASYSPDYGASRLTKRVGYRQDAFVDNYLNNQREHIFSNVSVLIFVFDVESRDLQVMIDTCSGVWACAKHVHHGDYRKTCSILRLP